MILMLLTAIVFVAVFCIGGLVWCLIKNLKRGSRSWRDLATQLALAAALCSALVVIAYLVRVSAWRDPSAEPQALIGIGTFVQWGHWGFWIAIGAFLTAWLAHPRERVLSLMSALFFGAFWLVGYTTFYL